MALSTTDTHPAQLTFDEQAIADAYIEAAHRYVVNSLDEKRIFLLGNNRIGEGIIIAPLQTAQENWALYNNHAEKCLILDDPQGLERAQRAKGAANENAGRAGEGSPRVERLETRQRTEGMVSLHEADTEGDAPGQRRQTTEGGRIAGRGEVHTIEE